MGRSLGEIEVLVEERFAAHRLALELQAAEYERRLDTLNHEHERVRQIQAQSVTQERFEQYARNEAEKTSTALDRVNERVALAADQFEAELKPLRDFMAEQRGATASAAALILAGQRRTQLAIAMAVLVVSAVAVLANVLVA